MKRVIAGGIVAFLATTGSVAGAHAATADYDRNTVIVKYREGSTSSQRSLAGRLAGVVGRVGRVRAVGAEVVRVTRDPAVAAVRLNRSRAVAYAEPNYIARAIAVPDDPRFAEQYALNNTGQTGGTPDADIDAPEGWEAAYGAAGFPTSISGAKIGIIDTGVLADHEDLRGKVVNCAGVRSFGIDVLGLIVLPLFTDPTIVGGRCADDHGHGTHVAGIAAARANNGRGIAGVAFDSPLAVCKGLDALGAGAVAGIANCIAYLASSGAKVVSMSLGMTVDSTTLRTAIAAASTKALIVAAAGNGGDATSNYPADYPEVVSVAATDDRDRRAPFSTFNAGVEIAAPGANVLSTWRDGAYTTLSGTSMAVPHVAGAAALIAGRYPDGGPSLWRTKLGQAVDDLPPAGRDPETGLGRVNLLQAATE